jgi:putative endonuclease
LAEHNGKAAGAQRGAKSTRGRVWALVYAEKHRTRKGAMRREWALKCDKKFRAALRNC